VIETATVDEVRLPSLTAKRRASGPKKVAAGT